MATIERHLGELTVELGAGPHYFTTNQGRDFVTGIGPLKVETRKSPWPALVFLVGLILFAAFWYVVKSEREASKVVFMVLLLGGMFGSLIGGVVFLSTLMTPLVGKDATHIFEGTVTGKRRIPKGVMWEAGVEYMPPGYVEPKDAKFFMTQEQQGAVSAGTKVAVLYAEKKSKGEVL